MTLANKITLARFLLIPVCLILLYGGFRITATLIFIIACLTDFLDGYFARKRNEVSNFGKFFDAFVDKVLILSVLIVLLDFGLVAGWIVLLILFRELIVSGLRTLAAHEGKIVPAAMSGKIKAAAQMAAIVLVLLEAPYSEFMMMIAALITLISGAEYVFKMRKLIRV